MGKLFIRSKALLVYEIWKSYLHPFSPDHAHMWGFCHAMANTCVFTARRYAKAVARCPIVSVCLSVRPSVCHFGALYPDG